MKKILWAIIIYLAANIANAEGAWVLWEGTTELGLPCEWKIVTAHPKYEQCIERHNRDFEIIKKTFENLGFKTRIISAETMVIEKVHSNTALGDVVITQKCLPDTIDPRK